MSIINLEQFAGHPIAPYSDDGCIVAHLSRADYNPKTDTVTVYVDTLSYARAIRSQSWFGEWYDIVSLDSDMPALEDIATLPECKQEQAFSNLIDRAHSVLWANDLSQDEITTLFYESTQEHDMTDDNKLTADSILQVYVQEAPEVLELEEAMTWWRDQRWYYA